MDIIKQAIEYHHSLGGELLHSQARWLAENVSPTLHYWLNAKNYEHLFTQELPEYLGSPEFPEVGQPQEEWGFLLDLVFWVASFLCSVMQYYYILYHIVQYYFFAYAGSAYFWLTLLGVDFAKDAYTWYDYFTLEWYYMQLYHWQMSSGGEDFDLTDLNGPAGMFYWGTWGHTWFFYGFATRVYQILWNFHLCLIYFILPDMYVTDYYVSDDYTKDNYWNTQWGGLGAVPDQPNVTWEVDGQYIDGVIGTRLIKVAQPGFGALLATIYMDINQLWGDYEYLLNLHTLELNDERVWATFLIPYYNIVWFSPLYVIFHYMSYFSGFMDLLSFFGANGNPLYTEFRSRFVKDYAWMDKSTGYYSAAKIAERAGSAAPAEGDEAGGEEE